MIDTYVLDYLNADSSLQTLLVASGSNTRIYPIQSPHNFYLDPLITYSVVSQGTLEENLKEISIQFNCIADTYLKAKQIKDRLLYLLDREDLIQSLIIGTPYIFYWCKHVGGSSFKDPDVDLFHNVLIFDFKYNEGATSTIASNIVTEASLHKQMVITIDGYAKADRVPYNAYPFLNPVTIKAGALSVENLSDQDITVDILQDDVALGKVMTLSAGSSQSLTNFSPFIFSNVNKFGIKILTAGTIALPGEGLKVTILYT